MKKDIFIEGDKVSLRTISEKDAGYFRWFNDADITRYSSHGVFPNTLKKQKEHIRHVNESGSDLQLAVILHSTRKLIGVIGIHQIDWINKRADISVIIGDKKFWGRGYASEAVRLIVSHAFNKLALHKLTAGMMDLNKGSMSAFLKNGFRKEAVLRDQFIYHGKYRGMVCMSLLAREFYFMHKD